MNERERFAKKIAKLRELEAQVAKLRREVEELARNLDIRRSSEWRTYAVICKGTYKDTPDPEQYVNAATSLEIDKAETYGVDATEFPIEDGYEVRVKVEEETDVEILRCKPDLHPLDLSVACRDFGVDPVLCLLLRKEARWA